MKLLENLWNQMVDYITNIELWITLGQGLLKISLIFIIASVFIRIGKIAISKIFLFRGKSPLRISVRRENTLAKLLENILTYVVYFIAIIMILETVGIKIGPLLAGAGILGLAVGFGAQNLVRDIITGFFIIFEDQFSVGDFIRVSTFEGTVEEIGLRTTKIKSWTGEVHILPNGNITEVTNFSIHNSVAFVDISIAYESDISEAERVIQELLLEIQDKYEDIVSPPELLGVQNLGASEVILRVTCEVEPMKHFHISRMLRKDIKTRLDERGIEIPYPRIVMYNRKDEVS
ncbi:mechanosensitive ion channel family protein [Metabacillus halosaccharovorans]|uniref:mechanosensitive ion channel family protein n=1 Tax=Metabacillus halosaccharovorans TaxID=930124 RepID=UPI002040572C|nr:mechanosensitive ion channel family protein [Metabacillus halosaccharovorans]MCM3441924.1 mechanosensitive ion channel family protein [Metabacillus halosaccharovorans]